MNGDLSMKIRLPIAAIQHREHPSTLVAAMCQHLDHAMVPLATASLVLGVIAVFLQTSRTANYLMATGLLLHLAVWFADWWQAARQK
jgi:uncharacterized membrane protein YqjE